MTNSKQIIQGYAPDEEIALSVCDRIQGAGRNLAALELAIAQIAAQADDWWQQVNNPAL